MVELERLKALTNRSARGALEERHTPRIIMGHYSGDWTRRVLLRMRQAAAKG